MWWTLALCAVTAVAPGAAFLLAWPLVFAWPAWLAAANTDEGSVATWVLTAPVVPLLVPVYLFLVQVGALSATGAISFAAVLLALTAPLVAPGVVHDARRARRARGERADRDPVVRRRCDHLGARRLSPVSSRAPTRRGLVDTTGNGGVTVAVKTCT